MASSSENDYSCPVCHDIFKTPVLLSCTHSFCKGCLQQFWKTNNTRKCPVCRKSSKDNPPLNRALQNLCESFLRDRNETRLSGSEEICSLHGEKLKLFCLEDKQPACLVCRDSQKHVNHTFRPISEVIPAHKEISTSLKSLQEKLNLNKKMKGEFETTVQHIKSQADHTEHQIKLQFEKFHQFLRGEEEATITALREEEKQKKQIMKEKLEEIDRHISVLSQTISGIEEMMKANDICLLKEFPVSMVRVQISRPDPQWPSGALIDVSRYLGNLAFRVWKKMQDIVYYTPVLLDPNTADPRLVVSDDLTRVTCSRNKQPIPDNPERFDYHSCILGSEGFISGKHCWDVDVKESRWCTFGVTTGSKDRKGEDFFYTDFWVVDYGGFIGFGFHVDHTSGRVRVDLDCDKGTVSFSDPVQNKHLYTYTTTFNDIIYPYFWCDYTSSLQILPFSCQQTLKL